MGGSLIQLASYGVSDIFLTGNPEITFFKCVYRRYTNFSIDSIRQTFNGEADFGYSVSCTIDPIADLMYKTYLEIDLPPLALVKHPEFYTINRVAATSEYQLSNALYEQVYNYIQLNTEYTRKLDVLLLTNSITMDEIQATMDSVFITPLVIAREKLIIYIKEHIKYILSLADLQYSLIQGINQIDVKILFDSVVGTTVKFNPNLDASELNLLKRKNLLQLINRDLYSATQDYYLIYYNDKLKKEKVYLEFQNNTYSENYNAAWVEEIGHSIIDTIEVNIGGQQIDRQTGDWFIIWNSLTLPMNHTDEYFKMIGNVPQLYDFNSKTKPGYKLIIPLQFWFCRFNGSALPLISTRFHQVVINLKLKELAKVFYFQDAPELMSTDNIQNQYDIHIRNVCLYVDYVYLDRDERRRFAQSSHEYLIDQVQYEFFENISIKHINARLNFSHPCKEFFWFAQPNYYRENLTGHNKCQWNNFGMLPDKSINPFDTCYLEVNSYSRSPEVDSSYYNYVQPHQCNTRSPSDGLNAYSIALEPEIFQPTGSMNSSRLTNLALIANFKDAFVPKTTADSNLDVDIPDDKKIFVGVYTLSTNILKFYSGMAGLAFQVTS
jgi:hypothetical protein